VIHIGARREGRLSWRGKRAGGKANHHHEHRYRNRPRLTTPVDGSIFCDYDRLSTISSDLESQYSFFPDQYDFAAMVQATECEKP
jgi:hypothetical protein